MQVRVLAMHPVCIRKAIATPAGKLGLHRPLTAGLLSSSTLLIGTAAGDADDRIICDDTTRDLFYDADGASAAAQVQFVNLDNVATDVVVKDFLVFKRVSRQVLIVGSIG